MSKIKVNRLENTATADGGIDIDSSGNVGVGSTSPASLGSGFTEVMISGATEGAGLQLQDTDGNVKAGIFTSDSSNTATLRTITNHPLTFRTNNTEGMRITNAGVVAINNTTGVFSDFSLGKLHVINDEANKYAAAFYHAGNNANRKGVLIAAGQFTGSGTLIEFADGDGNGIGTVTFSGSTTAYNTSSDYRLKENVVDIDGAISRIKQLAPKRFNFIGVERTVDGFLAHEAQTVVPEAVTGTHDEVDSDGNPEYQGIDQSKLVPLLTAALQEAIAKIETLETKVAALEAAE